MARFNSQPSYYNDRTYNEPMHTVNQVLWLVLVFLELFIGFRIFLKAIGANPNAGFANFVYTLTGPFLTPFAGLVVNPSFSNFILEITSIIAVLVYLILFGLAISALRVFWTR